MFSLAGQQGGEPDGQGALLSASASSIVRTKGAEDPQAVLVEYGDFQCPACAAYAPMVSRASEEFGDRLQLEFRHFPLTQIHKNAEPASRAAEAAGRHGVFWEMHDLLFERQGSWAEARNPNEVFRSYAEELGLDGEAFEADLSHEDVIGKVRSDMQSGWASNVAGTPTFFLNGRKMPYPKNYAEFRGLIERELSL